MLDTRSENGGLWINIGALIYIMPVYVFSFFPPTPNPTTETMNWSCVMYGGIIVVSTAYYAIWARKNIHAAHGDH